MFLSFTLIILGCLFFIGSIVLSVLFEKQPDMFIRKYLKYARYATECLSIIMFLIDVIYLMTLQAT